VFPGWPALEAKFALDAFDMLLTARISPAPFATQLAALVETL
jgi:hypothetical protein